MIKQKQRHPVVYALTLYLGKFFLHFHVCVLVTFYSVFNFFILLIDLDGREDTKVKIPDRVTVELVAHTNSAWSRVQSLSQNPRLRISIRPERPVSVIIDFLCHKWKSSADQIVGLFKL